MNIQLVPPANADWYTIENFALTFDGYAWAGNIHKFGEFTNGVRKGDWMSKVSNLSLDELRACLFFEQRRFRFLGKEPAGEDLDYIRALVQRIRESLSSV